MQRINSSDTMFHDGNPATGALGTFLAAAWHNSVQEEIAGVVEKTGIALDPNNNAQLFAAILTLIEANSGNYLLDTGAANAYVVAANPAIGAYAQGLTVKYRIAHSMTGASTLNAGAGAVPLLRDDGTPTQNGDGPAGSIVTATYDATALGFLINSVVPSQIATQVAAILGGGATGATPAAGDSSNKLATTASIPAPLKSISASVAANALTLGFTPVGPLQFRNASLTSGDPAALSAAAIGSPSLVVPSGATLGMTAGVGATLVLLLAYNAGSPVLCVANIAGGLPLDETNLISPTTIGAGATSQGTIYSASAVAPNSPYRIVGMVQIQEAIAGTWATAPTLVQGAGGEAFAALQSLGNGQSWQTVSRSANTTYYNTTGRPIVVNVVSSHGTANNFTIMTINGVPVTGNGDYNVATAATAANWIIPPGASYSISATSGTLVLGTWTELR